MQTDKPKSQDIDLDDTDLVHRYFARRSEVKKDDDPSQDPALEEQVENDWFAIGDQESWIEARPGAPRSWEMPRDGAARVPRPQPGRTKPA